MKKYLPLIITFLPVFAFASNTVEGTYIGANGKKSNISVYQQEGTYQYQLVLQRPVTGDIRFLTASEPKEISNNKTLTFNYVDNPYSEEPTSSCQIKVTFNEGKVEIQNLSDCDTEEQAYNGQYAYSESASVIPSEYWGKWGDCSEPAYINKDGFSSDGYHNFGFLGYTKEQNKLTLDGYSIDEGEIQSGTTEFTFLDNNRVKVKSYYDDKPQTLKMCK